jgi:hypothetical protein
MEAAGGVDVASWVAGLGVCPGSVGAVVAGEGATGMVEDGDVGSVETGVS